TRSIYDEEDIVRGQRISRTIGELLSGTRSMSTLETLRKRTRPRLGAFTVPPDVVIDNSASLDLTVIEVQALDRPGLLFDLACGLSDLGLDIASAHIATFGERAVDVFYVTDRDKKKVKDDNRKRFVREHLLKLLNSE